MSHCSFKCFISSCCSSTFNLSSLFTSMAFHNSLSYCGLLIFVFFTMFLYFPSPSSWLILPSQQQCLLCNFQPHLLRSIHDRLIYMLHTCGCLLPFHFWTFCHNNFTRDQSALSGYVFSAHFSLQMFDYISHTQP